MNHADEQRVRASIEAAGRQVTPSHAPLAATLQRAERRRRRQRRAVASSLAAVGLLVAGTLGVLAQQTARGPQPSDEQSAFSVSPMASSPLVGRADPTVVAIPGGVFYWGGVTSAEDATTMGAPDELTDDGAIFQVAMNAWTKVPDGPLRARSNAPAVWTGQSVLVAGGAVTSHGLHEAATYVPDDGKWRQLPDAPNCPLRMIQLEQRVYAFGQCDSRGGENASYFDLGDRTWTTLPRSSVAFPAAALSVDGSPAVMDGLGVVDVLDGSTWRRLPTLPGTQGIDFAGIAVGNVGVRVLAAVNSSRGTSSFGPADIYELVDDDWRLVGSSPFSPQSTPSQATTVGGALVFRSSEGLCVWRPVGRSGCQRGSDEDELDRDATELAALGRTVLLWGGVPITDQDAPPPLDQGVVLHVR